MRHHSLLALRDFCATVRPHQRAVIMLNCRSPVQSADVVHAVPRYVAAAVAAEEAAAGRYAATESRSRPTGDCCNSANAEAIPRIRGPRTEPRLRSEVLQL